MKTRLIIIVAIFSSQIINSQITAITEKGDTIKVFDNGTWEKIRTEKKIENIDTNIKTTVTVDEFDNSKKIVTERWGLFGLDKNHHTISGYLIKVNDLIVFSLAYSGDLGCLSEYSSTLKVKLSSGDIIDFSQISDTKCGAGEVARFIPLTRDELKLKDYQTILDDKIELLKKYDWETMRINGSEYYTDLKPRESRKVKQPGQFFRQHILASEKE